MIHASSLQICKTSTEQFFETVQAKLWVWLEISNQSPLDHTRHEPTLSGYASVMVEVDNNKLSSTRRCR